MKTYIKKLNKIIRELEACKNILTPERERVLKLKVKKYKAHLEVLMKQHANK